jgi:restriction system protein
VQLAIGNYELHPLGFMFAMFFTICFLIGIVWGIICVAKGWHRKKAILPPINNMTGAQFEIWCKDLLQRSGYTQVKGTAVTGDYGADLTAICPQGIKTVFQCKRYSGKVAQGAVREAYAARNIYGCPKSAVITNNYFTEAAKVLARSCGVLLIDRNKLALMVAEVNLDEAS